MADNGDELAPENTLGYKVGEKKTIEELAKMDEQDGKQSCFCARVCIWMLFEDKDGLLSFVKKFLNSSFLTQVCIQTRLFTFVRDDE